MSHLKKKDSCIYIYINANENDVNRFVIQATTYRDKEHTSH